MITVEQHETIRRMYYLDQQSGRQIAKTLGISRQSVAKALQSDLAPTYTRSLPREAPQLGLYKARLDELLNENRRLPRKQRYTAHKIFQILQTEGYAGSGSSVQGYAVHWRKAQRRPATFLLLEFEPGQDAQVDCGEAQAVIAGVPQMVHYFVMRLNYSRRSFVMAFPAQKQEAFFEEHVRAFEHFGGVPHRLSYDNLGTAVKLLVHGRIRKEQRALTAFRSYYLFESHFCMPAQGHEKGGVEHSVGFSRRNFIVPIPHVASFEDLNVHLLAECQRDDVRVVQGQHHRHRSKRPERAKRSRHRHQSKNREARSRLNQERPLSPLHRNVAERGKPQIQPWKPLKRRSRPHLPQTATHHRLRLILKQLYTC